MTLCRLAVVATRRSADHSLSTELKPGYIFMRLLGRGSGREAVIRAVSDFGFQVSGTDCREGRQGKKCDASHQTAASLSKLLHTAIGNYPCKL